MQAGVHCRPFFLDPTELYECNGHCREEKTAGEKWGQKNGVRVEGGGGRGGGWGVAMNP